MIVPNQSEPLVSVIMATYNSARFLPDSIGSILNQTLQNIELIIVNDGSTDDTAAVLSETHDPRIVVLNLNSNQGQGAARNAGMHKARGRFLAIQDADDISLPERLERQVQFLQQHDEVGVVGTGYYDSNSDAALINPRYPPARHTAIAWNMLFGTSICHGSVMFRGPLLSGRLFEYREPPPIEDFDFLARMVTHVCSSSLQDVLYVYRRHESSTMGKRTDSDVREAVLPLSAKLINRVLQGTDLSLDDVAALHRLRRPRSVVQPKDLRHVSTMYCLFGRFEQRPLIVHKEIIVLRRQWLKRLLASVPARQLPILAMNGVSTISACGDLAAIGAQKMASLLAAHHGVGAGNGRRV